ncbi:MAG: aldolase/citrate lyase family protein [Kiritimatiellae bacterium]|nr:aldolase/citrate lyase family protein [Kiritimatiellia bacterium]MDD5519791.1 aldolase/citrate lyase family protein [Kiritimatiellia bacterium]
MNKTKEKLQNKQLVMGSWLMIGNPAIAEIMAGEGFDFLSVDMEHTPINVECFYQLVLAAKGTGCDLLARLPSCDLVMAKQVLDMGAAGIIVPSVNSPAEAAQSVAIAKFPPEGIRGTSLCRASGFGSNFTDYYEHHNREVVVVVMLEHINAARQADAILATPGIDAALIGPYDLSSSMGLPGQLYHPDVLAAQQMILDACKRQNVVAGIHLVQADPESVRQRIDQGFRFIAGGIDTLFIREGCQQVLKAKLES